MLSRFCSLCAVVAVVALAIVSGCASVASAAAASTPDTFITLVYNRTPYTFTLAWVEVYAGKVVAAPPTLLPVYDKVQQFNDYGFAIEADPVKGVNVTVYFTNATVPVPGQAQLYVEVVTPGIEVGTWLADVAATMSSASYDDIALLWVVELMPRVPLTTASSVAPELHTRTMQAPVPAASVSSSVSSSKSAGAIAATAGYAAGEAMFYTIVFNHLPYNLSTVWTNVTDGKLVVAPAARLPISDNVWSLHDYGFALLPNPATGNAGIFVHLTNATTPTPGHDQLVVRQSRDSCGISTHLQDVNADISQAHLAGVAFICRIDWIKFPSS